MSEILIEKLFELLKSKSVEETIIKELTDSLSDTGLRSTVFLAIVGKHQKNGTLPLGIYRDILRLQEHIITMSKPVRAKSEKSARSKSKTSESPVPPEVPPSASITPEGVLVNSWRKTSNGYHVHEILSMAKKHLSLDEVTALVGEAGVNTNPTISNIKYYNTKTAHADGWGLDKINEDGVDKYKILLDRKFIESVKK